MSTIKQAMTTRETIVQASDFKDWALEASWYRRLETILNIFTYYFDWMAFSQPDDVPELIEDLGELLTGLFNDAQNIAAQDEEAIAASAGRDCKIEMTLNASADIKDTSNDHPFQGVLCKLNQSSEGVPAVGPGLPLYISTEVAQTFLYACSGLPLDAHSNLSEHDNESVVGVMLGGQISGDDFIVRGRLWGFNCPEKVAAIKANQSSLGMSMNAMASGVEDTIDGRLVYRVTRLKLMGANILYANKATYQQTKVVTAQSTPSGSNVVQLPTAKGDSPAASIPVAAATGDQNNPQGEPMDPELKQTLTSLAASSKQTNEILTTLVASQKEQGTRLEALEQRVQAEDAATAAIEKQQKEDADKKARDEAIEAAAQAAVARRLNPHGTPSRLTQPVSAGATGVAEISDSDRKIIELQAGIEALSGDHSPNTRLKRMQMRDQLRSLQRGPSPVGV